MVNRAVLLLAVLLSAAAAQRYTPPEVASAAAEEAPAADTLPAAADEAAEVVVEPAEPAGEDAEGVTTEEEEIEVEMIADEPTDESTEMSASKSEAESDSDSDSDSESSAAAESPSESPEATGSSSDPTSPPTYPVPSSSGIPACSSNTTKPWCLEDSDYPAEMIRLAIAYHHYAVLSLYQDVVADTENSVDRLTKLEEESYVCSSAVSYVQPLRAVNTDGDWRTIVNGIKVHYDTFTQTVRLEECQSPGEPCPLVPACYESACLQKSTVQRMLVYDPSDYYQPFAMDTFRLPSACACALGAYEISH
ncbi:uncharacterized protein LOC122376374 [Amphibalanus amphitrite]|uniref:uncharacterized protein LOC122376374 n=1 Tax=Amphibalanus amphitrite TaxID=1232801 RepID=UPI001C90D8FF|nr:uncharacterized protein LOC122376374 [Amphibalanus amphitrite]